MLTMRVKKYYLNELKDLAEKIDKMQKTWYELIKSEKVGLLMETLAKKGHVLRVAGRKVGDLCMWAMRVKNMLVFMVILKLGLISGLPCQYCWQRDRQRELASCDKGPSTCVQMMGPKFGFQHSQNPRVLM